MSTFLATVRDEYNRMRARAFATEGYEGVTVAGIAVVRFDGEPSVFMTKRSFDETDDKTVRETWEFPGGHLDGDEDPFDAAAREFEEEVGFPLPPGEVLNGWRSEDGHYQGFVYEADEFPAIAEWEPTDEVQAVDWFSQKMVENMGKIEGMFEVPVIRPEVRKMDWSQIWEVSGNKEDAVSDDLTAVAALTEDEPLLSAMDIAGGPIPIHGVLAPENLSSGDGRGFNEGAVSKRPLRLPFRWQEFDIGGHDGAFTIGSIDRMMRRDGLIHWEGSLMSTPKADEFVDYLVHFGRYGVSIDGDRGSLDEKRSGDEGMTWFDAVRIAGATAVDIPAFHEAYVALGRHPDMPEASSEDGSVLVAGASTTFDRGPGWITNPKETKRLHDYWTKKGEPGYAKIGWGTGGDYRRCVALVGEKIAKNSPEDTRYLKQICAQWHHDALGYWPGDLGKPGNNPERSESDDVAAAVEAVDRDDIVADAESGWESVLVSSIGAGERVRPPLNYFHRHPNTGATVIEDPDENNFRRTHGYAAEWGVCHVGYSNTCVEPPEDPTGEFAEFHLGRTRTAEGFINTGLLTYAVEHRDAETILAESPRQQHFDNIKNAWAAVRLGQDERGIWFSGVVLPKVDEDDLTLIEASGQVSGEWKYGALRALLTINTPGYGVPRSSAVFDDDGNVLALVASAFSSVDNGTENSPCADSPAEIMAALRQAHLEAEAEARFAALKKQYLSEKGA